MSEAPPGTATAAEDVTHDAFLGGKVIVAQPATGYRAGLDAVLLAAALEAEPGDRLAEAGCGAGAALFCAAFRLPEARLQGFERNQAMVGFAEQGVSLNRFGGRVSIASGDVGDLGRTLENAFDQSFANPPFFEPHAVRAPAPGKIDAFLADTPLKDWIAFLRHITKPGGRITLIHRAAALADILELLNPRTGQIEVMPVRPSPGAPAGRILVRARKGVRRGPLTLYDGLVLHESPGGRLTAEAAAIAAGGSFVWR